MPAFTHPQTDACPLNRTQAGNYYEVLALAQEASEAEVRRAKRVLALATHPDKIGAAPGANAAFNLVTEVGGRGGGGGRMQGGCGHGCAALDRHRAGC